MHIWQQQLAQSIHSLEELLAFVQVDRHRLSLDKRACQSFALRVPTPFAHRIKLGDPDDPLLRQVLPLQDELLLTPGYSQDPLEEQQANKTSGLLHKYAGRVLLILTGACAINCRYCFRRHFPYQDNAISPAKMQGIINYIQRHSEIYEVILSGGDPLMLKDKVLQSVVMQLERLNHLKYLRIHTRLPIMLPARVTDELLEILAQTRLKVMLIIHCNHINEIDAAVTESLGKLRCAGVTLLNQSVLLKGVNDNVEALTALSQGLYEVGVLPYYLHLLDAVQGAAHFSVDEQRAKILMKEVQSKLSGFLVPKLVKEIAGEKSKQIII